MSRLRRGRSRLMKLDVKEASHLRRKYVQKSASPYRENVPRTPITSTITPESVSSISITRRRQRLTSSQNDTYSTEDLVRDFMHNLYAELDDACVEYDKFLNPKSYSSDVYTIVNLSRQFSIERHESIQGTLRQPRYLKAALFGEQVSWITMIICAHSPTFIRRFLFNKSSLNDEFQAAIFACLKSNKNSIGMYAQTRHLNWQDALRYSSKYLEKRYNSQERFLNQDRAMAADNFMHKDLALPLGAKHPHEAHLSEDSKCKRNTVKCPAQVLLEPNEVPERVDMVNIDWYMEPFPDDPLWRGRQHWPIDYPLFRTQDYEESGKGKPTVKVKCYLCQDERKPKLPYSVPDHHPDAFCNCTIADLESVLLRNGLYYTDKPSGRPPRVEITISPTGCGVGLGVRALQHFRQNTFMGLFLGELYANNPGKGANPFPAIDRGLGSSLGLYFNSDYHFGLNDQRHTGNRRGMVTAEREFCIIDPTKYGNWTRYINHSCEANTAFVIRPIGRIVIVGIEAQRDIRWGDEITIDYGALYFLGRLDCLCGTESCRLYDAHERYPKDKERPIPLGEARRKGLS